MGLIACVSAQNSIHTDAIQQVSQRNSWGWVEIETLLNPIYITQHSSSYRLNHQILPIHPTPRFYALQTGQNAFLGSSPFSILNDLQTTFDQSNSYFGSVKLWFLDSSQCHLLRETRFIVGITHDKLQTSSPEVKFHYDNGGTELTFLLEKTLSKKLSDLDFGRTNLIFRLNFQAGILFALATVSDSMVYKGMLIEQADNNRLQFPGFNRGWGWQTGINFELGGVICHTYFISHNFTNNSSIGHGLFWFFKHLAFCTGARLMAEELYSSPEVLVDGKGGYRLKVNNFGIFFCGPVVHFKWLSLK
ncbi:MAG TPA: hypothetical protein VMH27_04885 [Puia sp.]|nr:hypothetical protein [Puia sp.]